MVRYFLISYFIPNLPLSRAAFVFTDNTLGVTAKGVDFDEFKSKFGPDDRGFGYIKIMVGSFW
jgi:hypothetical protein